MYKNTINSFYLVLHFLLLFLSKNHLIILRIFVLSTCVINLSINYKKNHDKKAKNKQTKVGKIY